MPNTEPPFPPPRRGGDPTPGVPGALPGDIPPRRRSGRTELPSPRRIEAPGSRETPRDHRIGRRALTAVVGGSILVGVGIGVNTLFDDDSKPQEIASESADREASAIDTPPELLAEYTEVLSRTDCSPEIARDAAEIHHTIFDPESYADLEIEDIEQRADTSIPELISLREQLDLLDLPAGYTQLHRDSLDKTPSLAPEAYEQALGEMLAPLDITVSSHWEPSGNHMDTPDDNILREADLSTPAERRQHARTLVGIIDGLSRIDKDTLRETGWHTVYQGDMQSEATKGGILTVGQQLGNYVMFDVVDRGETTVDPVKQAEVDVRFSGQIATHEVSHTEELTCILGAAWEHKNGEDFTYGQQSVETLDTAGRIGDATTLVDLRHGDNATTQAVVTRSYGAKNPEEDFATLIGETITHRETADRLFTDLPRSEALSWKTSLYLADLEQRHPERAEYYRKMLHIAALEAAAKKHLTEKQSLVQTFTLAEDSVATAQAMGDAAAITALIDRLELAQAA